jgi:hypothetical protein
MTYRIRRFILYKALALALLICYSTFANAQTPAVTERYVKALDDIREAFDDSIDINFKKVNFLTENTYFNNSLDYLKYNETIHALANMARMWMAANPLKDYRYKDSLDFHKNFAIYTVLKDSVKMIDEKGAEYVHLPYTYDFNDMFGHTEWSNMFVSKLLATGKGNCHNLPYLYKILADELGATCWLALAPNHIYIKNRCRKIGWYNTELTSGSFPIDAWVTASGYIPLGAIQNRIYMDTLSNTQAIAMCVLDLAKSYEFETRNYYDGFIMQCVDLVLKYHPVNVQAMLLKAETMKRVYEKQKNAQDEAATATYKKMEALYTKLFELGYREMPEKMYLQWLESVVKEKEKYANRKL